MRTLLVVALLLTGAGCRRPSPPPPPAAPPPNLDPYRNVTPQKVKERVEEIDRKADERSDKLIENAK